VDQGSALGNAVHSYNFKPGEAGKWVLEFRITTFDFAGREGPQRAVEFSLRDNKLVGLSWAVLDYGDVNASGMVSFRLMPFEPQFRKMTEARRNFKIVDMNRQFVAFQDESEGKITWWKWAFGGGTKSVEQHPLPQYQEPEEDYVVTLDVEGPGGKSRRAKVWDVQVR
jgi:hypothetical protein